MLLHAISEAACDAAQPGTAAVRAGSQVLTRIQAAGSGRQCLAARPAASGRVGARLPAAASTQGSAVDFAYFSLSPPRQRPARGIAFELDVPVRDGRVQLPASVPAAWPVRQLDPGCCCDGERVQGRRGLRGGLAPSGAGRRLRPSRSAVAGTPMVRAVADGLAWDVLLETADLYLDRYTLPMSSDDVGQANSTAGGIASSPPGNLVRHHRWTAEPIATGSQVLVPLIAQSTTDLISATTPAAFGAIATSWPPDPVTMAETLVHEFQHVKLCGLMDMVPLVEPGDEKVYAPWRQDPRPARRPAARGVRPSCRSRVSGVPSSTPRPIRMTSCAPRHPSPAGGPPSSLPSRPCWDGLPDPGRQRFAGMIQDQGERLESEYLPGDAQADRRRGRARPLADLADPAHGDRRRRGGELAAAYRRGEPFR